MSTSVKRACDACHRRKVKCDGINPCRNCSTAQLSCTYHAIPQKKGPKGSRAKVISELRETQRHHSSLSSKTASRLNGVHSPPCSPNLAPTPGLLTPDIIKECVDFFFTNMYPNMPILHRARLDQQAVYADHNPESYTLLTSLCAFMFIQPNMPMVGVTPSNDPFGLDSMPGANIMSGTLLLEETMRVRKSYDHLESPSLSSLVTSFFLFGCYYGLDLHNKAWFHLREAATLAHILGMHKEETYVQWDTIEASRRRRLYWLLFATERAYALQRQRPITLPPTISLPTHTDDPTEPNPSSLTSFIHLVALYRPFDDQFMITWNKARNDCSQEWLGMLQKQLTEATPSNGFGIGLGGGSLSESQMSDLRASQQWLRTMVWQINMQNGCLTTGSDDSNMSYGYSVEVARDLVSMTSQFSQQSMEKNGVTLIEKLLETTCALTSLLTLLPPTSDPFTLGPRDHLPQLLTLLSHIRSGDSRFLPLLLSKVNEILPQLASPMLRTVPEPTHPQKVEPMHNANNEFDMFGFDHSAAASALGMNKGPNINTNVTHNHNHNHFDGLLGANEPLPYGVAKRVEELGSGSSSGESPIDHNHSPFTSPPVMNNSMEFSGLDGYGGYSDLNSSMGNQVNAAQAQNMAPSMSMHSNPQQALSPGSVAGVPRTPIRQNSGFSMSGSIGGMSNGGMSNGGMSNVGNVGGNVNVNVPRNMEFHHYVKDEGLACGVDGGLDLPFR